MLKILLVDDEILVRVGIKMMVDWDKEGFEIAGEASNGQQALEMWSEIKPNIIITDMKMPLMDGAELIKKLKQQDAKSKILVLSCYDDYNYMKEALNCGAVDYILKSEMTKEDLTQTLRRIKQQIVNESRRENEYNQLKIQAELNSYLTKEKFFKEVIYGKYINFSDIRNALKDYNIDADESYFSVAIITVDKCHSLQNSNDAEILSALEISLFNIIQGVINSVSSAILLHDNKPYHYIAVFYNQKSKMTTEDTIRASLNIIQAVKTYIQITVSISISELDQGIGSTRRLLEQAQEISKYKILFGAESILTCEMLKEGKTEKYEYRSILKTLSDTLYNNIYNENYQMNNEVLEKIFKLIKMDKSIYLLNAIMIEFTGWFNRQITEISINENSNHDKSIADYIAAESLFEFDCIEDVKDFIMEKILLISNLKTTDNQGNRIVNKAMDYIKQNYSREITLSDVAEHVSVSKNYLSIIFKTETGQNFIDFITNLRVNEARTMLENENLKLYEVASKVGFENERYFSQIFRKKTGMTPTEYKKKYTRV